MYKIRKVDFLNHPILGNLSLNFCDANGMPWIPLSLLAKMVLEKVRF